MSPLAQLLSSDNAPVDDRARAARVLGALRRCRAPRMALLGGARARGRRRCARRWSRRSARAPGCARRGGAGGRTPRGAARRRRRARRTCCGRCRRWPSASPSRGATRVSRPCERRWRRSAASRSRARAVMALGAMGAAGDPAALAELRDKGDDPVLRYLATRELAAWPAAGRRRRAPCPARGAGRRRSARARDRGAGARQAGRQRAPPTAADRGREAGAVAVRAARRAGGARAPVRARRRRSDAARDRRGTSTRSAAPRWSGWPAARTAGAHHAAEDPRAPRTRARPCASWRRR